MENNADPVEDAISRLRRAEAMGRAMCKFTDSGSRAIVYVNPVLVRLAKTGARGTDIVFDHDQSITVSERLETVVEILASGSLD